MSDYDRNLAVPRAGGLRTIRIVLVLACLGIMANIVDRRRPRRREHTADHGDQRGTLRNTERNCMDVNRRHDNALRALNVLYAERVRRVTGPRERELVRQSRVSSAC